MLGAAAAQARIKCGRALEIINHGLPSGPQSLPLADRQDTPTAPSPPSNQSSHSKSRLSSPASGPEARCGSLGTSQLGLVTEELKGSFICTPRLATHTQHRTRRWRRGNAADTLIKKQGQSKEKACGSPQAGAAGDPARHPSPADLVFAWVQIARLVQTSVSIFYRRINVKPAVACVKTTTAVYLFMILQLVKAW